MRISRENLEMAKLLDRYFVPEGWKLLGAGSSRTAFLGPDGLVYKVPSWGDTFQNRNEANVVWAWRKRTDLPTWCIIPRAHFDTETGVTVMEYHEGTQPKCDGYRGGCECGQAVCWRYRLGELSNLGWSDTQTANAVLTRDGNVVIIDLGCNTVSDLDFWARNKDLAN